MGLFDLRPTPPSCHNPAVTGSLSSSEPAPNFQFLYFRCTAEGVPLLVLYLKTILLSIFTLGIYSFWGRTHIRRYLHNEVLVGGDRFEWHGTAVELLLGWVKAIAVLAVIYGVFFAATLSGSEWVKVGAVIALYLGIFSLMPFVLVGSTRYRLSRTSLRGIRFSSTARVGEFSKFYFKGLFLTMITLGFYSPWYANNIVGYLTRTSRYGDQAFGYDGTGRPLFGPYIAMLFLLLPTLYLITFWYLARQQRHFYGHTTFGPSRFECTIRGRQILWTMFSNALLVIFTFGIGYPWAVIRNLRLQCETLRLYGSIELSAVHQLVTGPTATGEALGQVLEVESDIGGAFGL